MESIADGKIEKKGDGAFLSHFYNNLKFDTNRVRPQISKFLSKGETYAGFKSNI